MQKTITKNRVRVLVIAIAAVGVATVIAIAASSGVFPPLRGTAISPNDPGCYLIPITNSSNLHDAEESNYGACLAFHYGATNYFACFDRNTPNQTVNYNWCLGYLSRDGSIGTSYANFYKYCPDRDCATGSTNTNTQHDQAFYYCPIGSTTCQSGWYKDAAACKQANQVSTCYTGPTACSDVCTPPPPPPRGTPYYFCVNSSASGCTTVYFNSLQACQDQTGLKCYSDISQCNEERPTNCLLNGGSVGAAAWYYYCNSSTDETCSYSRYQSLSECQQAGHTCYVSAQKSVCQQNISKDCPPPPNPNPTVWWCSNSTSCTSGTTPPAGAKTYTTQSECVNRAGADCSVTPPPPPQTGSYYWCDPSSNNACSSAKDCPAGKKCYTTTDDCTKNYAKDCPATNTQLGCCVYRGGFLNLARKSSQLTSAQCSQKGKIMIDWCANTQCTSDNRCAGAPNPTDLCPNISGTQSTIPSGMVADSNGNCVRLAWWYDSKQGTCVSGPVSKAPTNVKTYDTKEQCTADSTQPQGDATVSGTVKAASTGDFPTGGAPISGASVTLFKKSAQFGPTSSNAQGIFTFKNLVKGQYGIQITANGFLTYCGQATAPSSGNTYKLFPATQPNNDPNYDCQGGRPPLKPAMQYALSCMLDKLSESTDAALQNVSLRFTSFARCDDGQNCHTLGLAADFIPTKGNNNYLTSCQPFLNLAHACGLYFMDERHKDPLIIYDSCGSNNSSTFRSGAHFHVQLGQSCSAQNPPPTPPNPYNCTQ